MSITRMLEARNVDRNLYAVVTDGGLLGRIDAVARLAFAHPGSIVDIGAQDEDGLRSMVRPLLPERGDVFVSWSAQRAIRLPGQVVAERVSDLWRPSSDDVAVLALDLSVLFAIHHEEKLLLYDRG